MSPEKILQSRLISNRLEKPIGLDLEIPLSYQLDQEYCKVLNNELPGNWEVRRATKGLWRTLPEECGIYMFVFQLPLQLTAERQKIRPHYILYIGRAGDENSTRTFRDRYKGEYDKYIEGDPAALWEDKPVSSRAEKLRKYLTIYPLEYWFYRIEDRSKISSIESKLIRFLNPPLNTVGKARLRKKTEVPAFKEH